MSRKHRNQPRPTMFNTMVDIIICVYNRFDLLEQCLASIPSACGDLKYQIILVDNASSEKEQAQDFYSRLDSKVILIKNKENFGFPKACNIGFRRGTAPLIFMLNSDVILQPDSINKLVLTMDDPKVGVAGMKLLFPEHAGDLKQDRFMRPAGKVQHVGLNTNIRGEFTHSFIGWDADHPKTVNVPYAYAVTGAALMTRRWLYQKIGGFLEAYGRGTWEDVDFCLSARKLGYNVVVNTEALGTHYTGATAEKYKIPYPMDMNKMIFLQRWAQELQYTEWIVL